MRDLLGREAADPHAAQAVEMFCYQARKFVAAMASALGGLDTFVFTAGVGTNAPEIRQRICHGLDFMGIRIDAARNESNAAVISPDDSPVTVRVMKTDEELMIARHTHRLLNEGIANLKIENCEIVNCKLTYGFPSRQFPILNLQFSLHFPRTNPLRPQNP